VEEHSPGSLASILLMDSDGLRLQHGAAPSLPRGYVDAIEGIRIGPIAGSCGTAAYRKEPVVVADIANDPLWVTWRDLALPHGLRACCRRRCARPTDGCSPPSPSTPASRAGPRRRSGR